MNVCILLFLAFTSFAHFNVTRLFLDTTEVDQYELPYFFRNMGDRFGPDRWGNSVPCGVSGGPFPNKRLQLYNNNTLLSVIGMVYKPYGGNISASMKIGDNPSFTSTQSFEGFFLNSLYKLGTSPMWGILNSRLVWEYAIDSGKPMNGTIQFMYFPGSIEKTLNLDISRAFFQCLDFQMVNPVNSSNSLMIPNQLLRLILVLFGQIIFISTINI